MPNILIVGATRGLGAELVKAYTSGADNYVLATARSNSPPSDCKDQFAGLVPNTDLY